MPTRLRLDEDLKAALKAGKKDLVMLLRFLLAQLQNRSLEKKAKTGNAELEETEVLEILKKEVKKRKEAIELFRKGGREDLALHDEAELQMIAEYLPPALDPAEIRKVVQETIKNGATDFASIMREAMKTLKGRADGREVTAVIQEELQRGNS